MKALTTVAAGAALLLSSWGASAGVTFESVKNKGFVQCGVSTGVAGFSVNDSKGGWMGLDVDLCRALAVTMFGDASKAKIMAVSAVQRFTALQSGEVDVLPRNTTLSLTRDTTLGLIGVGVN
ncbi:transporter substrate-binding domain-containing protein, partial [Achromobacter xylosoxidans]